MRVTSGVATTTAGAAGGTGSDAERHPLRLGLAIARHKSHELGGWHLRPVTRDGMSDDLRVDDQSTTIALRQRPPRHTTSNRLGASPYLREAVAAARLQDYASWTTGCH